MALTTSTSTPVEAARTAPSERPQPNACERLSTASTEHCIQLTTADASVRSADAAWSGVAVGGLTLLAAIAAAIYARRAANYSREIGHAQVRCYLSIKKAKFQLENAGHPRMAIAVTNSGQTPAKAFRWTFEVSVTKIGPNGWHWSHVSGQPVPGRNIPAQSTEKFNLGIIDDKPLAQGDLSDLLLNPQVRIKAKVKVWWTDVFGKEFSETWPFEALLPGVIDAYMALHPDVQD